MLPIYLVEGQFWHSLVVKVSFRRLPNSFCVKMYFQEQLPRLFVGEIHNFQLFLQDDQGTKINRKNNV